MKPRKVHVYLQVKGAKRTLRWSFSSAESIRDMEQALDRVLARLACDDEEDDA